MQFINQIISEDAHNPIALQFPSSPGYFLLFSVTSVYTSTLINSVCPLLLRNRTATVWHSTTHPGILSRFLSGHMLSFRMLVEQHCLSPLGHQCQSKSVESCWQEKRPSIGNNKQVPYCWPYHLSWFPHGMQRSRILQGQVSWASDIYLLVRSASISRLYLCIARHLANFLYWRMVGGYW